MPAKRTAQPIQATAVVPPAVAPLDWEDVRIFLAVVDAKSISGAARSLKLGQPTVSRRIAEFEARLGGTLFERNVEGVVPTALGERLRVPATRMAEWAGEVARATDQGETALTGVVRVTAPPLVAMAILPKLARRVKRLYPELRLEILSTVRYLDLVRGEADLAIRTRTSEGPQLHSVGVFNHHQRVYVARRLARRLPAVKDPRELPWLAWVDALDHIPPNPQLRQLIPGFVAALTTDDILVMLEALRAGVGAMVLAEPIARLLGGPSLVPLEIDLGPYARAQTHVIAARSALGIPRIQAVSRLLLRLLKRESLAD